MTIDTRAYATFLEKVAENIDIPPGKYKEAVDRYEAVGRWLGSIDIQDSLGGDCVIHGAPTDFRLEVGDGAAL